LYLALICFALFLFHCLLSPYTAVWMQRLDETHTRHVTLILYYIFVRGGYISGRFSCVFFSLLPLLEHRADFSVSWSFADGRTLCTGDQLVARPLRKHRTTQTQKNAHTHQTSMPWVGFEPTIPAS
jgi:hypothetical protein